MSTSIERAISGPRLSHSQFAKSLAILSEIRGRVVKDFVLIKKSVDLHPRLEGKEPPKLCSSEGMRPICFERQAFESRTSKITPLRFEHLSDVLRQL